MTPDSLSGLQNKALRSLPSFSNLNIEDSAPKSHQPLHPLMHPLRRREYCCKPLDSSTTHSAALFLPLQSLRRSLLIRAILTVLFCSGQHRLWRSFTRRHSWSVIARHSAPIFGAAFTRTRSFSTAVRTSNFTAVTFRVPTIIAVSGGRKSNSTASRARAPVNRGVRPRFHSRRTLHLSISSFRR